MKFRGGTGRSRGSDRREPLRFADDRPSPVGSMLLLGLVAFLAGTLGGFWYLLNQAPNEKVGPMRAPDSSSLVETPLRKELPRFVEPEAKVEPPQEVVDTRKPEGVAEPKTEPQPAPIDLTPPVAEAPPPEPEVIDTPGPKVVAESKTEPPPAPVDLRPSVAEAQPAEMIEEPIPGPPLEAVKVPKRRVTTAWARDRALESELAGRGVTGVKILRKDRSLRLRGTVQNDYQLRTLYRFVYERGFGEVDYGVEVR